MAQFVIINIEAAVKRRLRRRAAQHGRRLEEEVEASRGLGTEIAALFAKVGLDSEIPELRGNEIEPPCARPN